jgi:uncharacterized protein YjbI with pentapeptide repeats
VLRVIDAQAGENCASGEKRLSLATTQCNGFPRTGVDWRNCDFHGVNLENHSINASRMDGINLALANVKGANLFGTNLSGAYLVGAVFSRANLGTTNLTGADLAAANLSASSIFFRTRMAGAIGLTSTQLRSVKSIVNFGSACADTGPDLQFVDFTGLNFTGFDLHAANFRGSVLSGVNLTNANLTNTVYSGTVVANANFTNADLTCAGGIPADAELAEWNNTTCPDGTNSDNNGDTCAGHF